MYAEQREVSKGTKETEGDDEVQWDPDWDLDPAASQFADPEMLGDAAPSTMDLGSTAYLLTLKVWYRGIFLLSFSSVMVLGDAAPLTRNSHRH